MLLLLLAAVFALFAFVCNIIVIIAAFQDEIWKGVLSLLCGFYLLYYMVAEFSHEKKGLILAGAIGGSIFAYVCYVAYSAEPIEL